MPRIAEKRRAYRRKFSGIRTDTKPVREIQKPDGRRYVERQDGSKYPKSTSISISPSILQIYSTLRAIGKYNNYDELLLDMFEWTMQTGKLKGSSQLGLKETRELRMRAKMDIKYREKDRNKAKMKHRYKPR